MRYVSFVASCNGAVTLSMLRPFRFCQLHPLWTGVGWEGRQANRGWVGEHRHTGRERERDGHLERQTILEYTGEQRDRQTEGEADREREGHVQSCYTCYFLTVMLYMLLLDGDTLQLFQHC